jgi:mono/diheme cytochrome c family protein
MKYRTLHIFLLVVVSLGIVSCDRTRNNPGYSYFPDMENSQAYETYSENPVYANGNTNQLPVENTVPREMIPYNFEKTPDNRVWAGLNLPNPISGEHKQKELAEGKRLYEIYCISCHGEKGDGQGFLYTSGKFPYPPASLIADKIKDNPEGEIFHVISVGFGVMGAHNGQILPDDRWRIVNYITEELHK